MSKNLKLPPVKNGTLVANGGETGKRGGAQRVSFSGAPPSGRFRTGSQLVSDDLPSTLALTGAADNNLTIPGEEYAVVCEPLPDGGQVCKKKPKTLWQKLGDTEENKQTSDKQKNQTDEKGRKERVTKRFRRLARMVKMNLAWTKNMREQQQQDENTFTVSGGTDGRERLTFDINNFKLRDRTYGGLTNRARRILCKNPVDRTEAEVLVLKDVVDRLSCFDKYPRNVRHELARVICYDTFEDGRVIIQQGHMGLSFYFIVSGKVIISVMEADKKTGEKVSQVYGELSEGQSFGELALMHNIRRAATIACKGNVQLLRVDKDDFGDVLKMNYQQGWQRRYNALHWLPQFKGWKEEDIKLCTNSSHLLEYAQDKVILGNTADLGEFIQFIVTGEAQVVREMRLILSSKQEWGGAKTLTMPTRSQESIIKRQRSIRRRRMTLPFKVKHCFWTVCTLTPGLYFGAGENLTDTYIMAQSRLECLLVPRLFFMKYGYGKMLESLKTELDAVFPSNLSILQQYSDDMHWTRYKQSVVAEVIQRRAVRNSTALADVPETMRVTSPLPLDLKIDKASRKQYSLPSLAQ